jgi:hypothetical protein
VKRSHHNAEDDDTSKSCESDDQAKFPMCTCKKSRL